MLHNVRATQSLNWCGVYTCTIYLYVLRGLSKKYLTLFFPGKLSDGSLAYLITVVGGPSCACVILCGLAWCVFLS
jgi:hypothetical protein